ncbi:hypothetical protein [Marinomonas fungiae]|uniref:Uncharacterized protein n=1 Tax=Marinomonas fungiae TaxID=1137284 RepID=A0A0K6IIT7_9GAMM|nr:hypothetical protein [Marinomonas fungiae]CUB03013.1 hypothetical protein Ga0061065_102352 [Marinomonas fungiae]
MDATNSAHAAFDQRRTRFSDWIVQYGLLFTLLFFGLLSGTYYVANERIEATLKSASELHDIAYSSLVITQGWQTISPDREQGDIASLLQQERLLVQRLREQMPNVVDLPSAPVTISQFTVAEQVRLAESRLSQIQQIATEYSSRLGQMNVLQHPMVVGLILGWTALLVYLIWGWRRVLLDRQVALSFFHSQVDRLQSGSHLSPPLHRNDEFGDFARYLNSVLTSISGDLAYHRSFAQLYRSALSTSLSLKLVVNHSYEILNVSEGLSELWILEPSALSEALGVDAHLTSLEGEVVAESVFLDVPMGPIRIANRLYEVRLSKIEHEPVSGYLIELAPIESHAELRVLEATLSLMSSDVWDAPIRILDESSPYYSFSEKLERTRQQVFRFLQQSNELINNADKEYPKITKLQQLSDWLIAKLNSNEMKSDECSEQRHLIVSEIDISRQDFLRVREQVEYRFELYEAYLQQMVEWQASQATWVATVNEGLLDTKEAILNLLTIVHTEPTSASVIEHSVIDLTHDIDTVLNDILESKPIPGELRIEHVKSSESELMRRLNDVQIQLDHLSEVAQQEHKVSHQ